MPSTVAGDGIDCALRATGRDGRASATKAAMSGMQRRCMRRWLRWRGENGAVRPQEWEASARPQVARRWKKMSPPYHDHFRAPVHGTVFARRADAAHRLSE